MALHIRIQHQGLTDKELPSLPTEGTWRESGGMATTIEPSSSALLSSLDKRDPIVVNLNKSACIHRVVRPREVLEGP